MRHVRTAYGSAAAETGRERARRDRAAEWRARRSWA